MTSRVEPSRVDENNDGCDSLSETESKNEGYSECANIKSDLSGDVSEDESADGC